VSGSINISGHKCVYRQLTEGIIEFTPVEHKPSAAKIAECLWAMKIKGIQEVIGTQDNFVIISNTKIQKLIRRLGKVHLKIPKSKKWFLPIYFSDTEDWGLVEKTSGMTRDAYVDLFLKSKLKVEMLGFIPGFIYLKGLNKRLQAPRKKTPVHNPLKNALAVGGPYAGIYSLPSPAGWNIIGEIPIDILQIDAERPVPFAIGDRLVFREIDRTSFEEMKSKILTIQDYNA